MAFKTFNRVKLTLTGVPTPATGTLNLSTPSSGFQTLSSAGVADGDVIPYVIEDGANWEVGYGQYGSAGTTLSRGPTQSSSGGAAISCTADAIVSATILAEDLNQSTLRLPGGEWTPIDFASGTTSCLALSLHMSAQTFVMSTGNRLEIEAYVHGTSGGNARLLAMQGAGATTGIMIMSQTDGNWVLYEVYASGASANSLAATGSSSPQTYSGVYQINLNIVCLGSFSSLVDGNVNAFLTGIKHPTTPDLSGTLSIGLETDAIGNCSGRARLLV